MILYTIFYFLICSPLFSDVGNFPILPNQEPTKLKINSLEYDFTINKQWLIMSDGTKLAITIFQPEKKSPNEKFPVLLEALPYRKDDSFYLRDYPFYSYFAKHGYMAVKLDIRGTGSSEGQLPSSEYSEQEMEDILSAIYQLSSFPAANGKVGMWGISWGGFNTLQIAMRNPKPLKAILAIDASDSLFHDDVHYIDGIYHIDPYQLEINHENALPKPPEYHLDEAYFTQRFNQTPWLFTYLKNQNDGEFWEKKSLKKNYDAIMVPTYVIGGLLDGYRDSIPHMVEKMKVPLKAEIGPWNHDFPDVGAPGPNYDWQLEAVKWWDHWLKDKDNEVMGGNPPLALFIREGNPPDIKIKKLPGYWCYSNWPIKETIWTKFFPTKNHQLGTIPEEMTLMQLRYVPSFGVVGGDWWGELIGDMRKDDAGSLVFDSPLLEKEQLLVGFPKVKLQIKAQAPLEHWIARLEDVSPNGQVTMVTGAAMNSAQRDNSLTPSYLITDQVYNLNFELHFTTWTFKPGHRIRLAITNAQFPMLWSTPYTLNSTLQIGELTSIELPIIPSSALLKTPKFQTPQKREKRPDAHYLRSTPDKETHIYDAKKERMKVTTEHHEDYEISGKVFHVKEIMKHTVSDNPPFNPITEEDEVTTIQLQGRELKLHTHIKISSDQTNFDVTVAREILENNRLIKKREWSEKIPRMYQ